MVETFPNSASGTSMKRPGRVAPVEGWNLRLPAMTNLIVNFTLGDLQSESECPLLQASSRLCPLRINTAKGWETKPRHRRYVQPIEPL